MQPHELLMGFSNLAVALGLILLTTWAERPRAARPASGAGNARSLAPPESGDGWMSWNVEPFFGR